MHKSHSKNAIQNLNLNLRTNNYGHISKLNLITMRKRIYATSNFDLRKKR